MTLKENIEATLKHSPRATFTIENGRGETYRNARPTLYAHDQYERGSVLAGQPRRSWLDNWTTWDDARAAVAELPANLKRKVEVIDGSTFIPTETLLDRAGIPHDEDY